MGHVIWRVLIKILCNHDPKVKVKIKKGGYIRWCTNDFILAKFMHTIILIVLCVQDGMTNETVDSHAQAHQELHCLSMWKRWN